MFAISLLSAETAPVGRLCSQILGSAAKRTPYQSKVNTGFGFVNATGTGSTAASYTPTAADEGGTLEVVVTVADQGNPGNTETTTVTAANAVGDVAPILNGVSGTATEAVQDGAAVTLLVGAPTVTGQAGPELKGATVRITNFQSGDTLAVNTSGTAISAATNTDGTLTLSGADTVADYEQVLAAVTYQNAGSDTTTGGHPTRTIAWSVTDGIMSSNIVDTTLTIDRPPTQATHTINVNESASTGALAAGDSDPDGDSITVTALSGGMLGGPDAGTYGTLTLNANDTFSYTANNFAAINAAPAGTVPTDTFTYTVSDGHGGSTTETLDFAINRLPEAPNSNLEEWVMANGQFAVGAAPGPIPGDFKVAAIGDFTGNGTDDILWQSPSSGDVAEWIMSNAAWDGTVDFGKAPAGLQIEGAGNFFGSNAPSDVPWFDPNTGETDLWKMSGGQWAGSVNVGTIPGTGWQVAGIGDFTGTGTDDVLWHNTHTGDVAEWQIQNGQWAGSVDFGTPPAGLELEGVGKFLGSNAPDDVLWLNPNTGEADLWEMSNGHWAATVNVGTIPGLGWQVAGIGDFTGTGTDDILWHNSNTGDFAEWLIQDGHWAGSVDFGNVPGWNVAGTGHFISGNSTSDILWHFNTSPGPSA